MPFPFRSIAHILLVSSVSIAALAQAPAASAPDPSELGAPASNTASPPASNNGTPEVASNPAVLGKTSSQPSVVVVLDSSAASSGNFRDIRRAASDFIKALGDERDVAVVAASENPTVVADFNAEPEALAKRLDSIKPRGKPALQQSIDLARQHASAESDNAAVVVFVRNPDPAPPQTNASSANVPVYVIASPESKWKVQSQMQQLAVKSGGTAYFPSSYRELREVVKDTATRVVGHPVVEGDARKPRDILKSYERIIVREIPIEESNATAEAAGGENLLMQQVLVARIRKAKLFPIVVNGADQHSVDSASTAPIGNALELRATVVEFRRGNKVARQFLAGMKGGAKMKLRVVLVDTNTNKPVLAFNKEATYASGLWGGSAEHVQTQAMLRVANEIVEELKRLK